MAWRKGGDVRTALFVTANVVAKLVFAADFHVRDAACFRWRSVSSCVSTTCVTLLDSSVITFIVKRKPSNLTGTIAGEIIFSSESAPDLVVPVKIVSIGSVAANPVRMTIVGNSESTIGLASSSLKLEPDSMRGFIQVRSTSVRGELNPTFRFVRGSKPDGGIQCRVSFSDEEPGFVAGYVVLVSEQATPNPTVSIPFIFRAVGK